MPSPSRRAHRAAGHVILRAPKERSLDMKSTRHSSATPSSVLICRGTICSGQIAQKNTPSPEPSPIDAPVAPGKRTVCCTVRRTVRRVVIPAFLVILTVLFVAANPLEAWWIGRSTATSWPLWWSPLTSPPELSPLRLSLTLPDDRRPKAHEDFTLTLGLGTSLSTPGEACLTIHAPGFDIIDRSSTTHTDTYTRTITDFSYEDYGMVSTQNRLERVWEIERLSLCGYAEDFTLRWRGEAPATDTSNITASLQTVGTGDHIAHGYAATAVYYTAKSDRLRLTTKRPR